MHSMGGIMRSLSRRVLVTGFTSAALLGGLPSVALAATSVLAAGGTLATGASLVSPNGRYACIMQGDGNLVVYRSGGVAIWNSGTGGQGPSKLIAQGDGNLVIYKNGGGATWSTSTNGVSAPRLVMQDDGNLVLYDNTNRAVWCSTGGFIGDRLLAGERLTSGQQMVSRGGKYRLIMQSDGNLVIYTGSTALWNTSTGGQGPSTLVNQTDGNLVVYKNSAGATWASSSTSSPLRLVMQTDGNLVLYNGSGVAVWCSGSAAGVVVGNGTIVRAQSWTSRIPTVPYSQSSYYSNFFGRYRQDCSGYVSMAWALSSSLTTFTLPQVSHQISKSQLAPGDVLLNTSSHVLLFAGWADSAQTRYWAYEQTPPATVYHQVTYPYWPGNGTFLPFRKN